MRGPAGHAWLRKGKPVFLAVSNLAADKSCICERLGQSDVPGVGRGGGSRMLFEMPVFDFSASNKRNDIYSTHTL